MKNIHHQVVSFRCIILCAILLNILGSCGGNETIQEPTSTETSITDNKIEKEETSSFAKGEEIYSKNCQACHQANGEGIAKAFPPLAKSDYLLADKLRAIKQVINGSTGEIIVNGQTYNSAMPPQALNDQEIADVLNYVLHSWGNNGETITVEEVKANR